MIVPKWVITVGGENFLTSHLKAQCTQRTEIQNSY